MIKVVILLRRREDFSREQFIDYYENNHAVLARRLLPSAGRYVRNYLEHDTLSISRQPANGPMPYFDVMTEMWFDDEDSYREFRKALSEPEIIRQIQEDEARFLDTSVMQSFRVTEYDGDR